MKIDTAGTAREYVAFILTGNGRQDIKILEAICEKYDHERVLTYPKLPATGGKTGLAVIDSAVGIFEHIHGEIVVLLLIDKEHLKDINTFEKELLVHGFRVLEKKPCSSGYCVMFIVSRGPKQGLIILAIQGKDKNLEENLSDLIYLRFREKVEPEKQALRKWLREQGRTSLKKLIEETNIETIEKAFPALTDALKFLVQRTRE